ncbi:MAG: hypothetical protein WAO95_18195 [Burkholderiales bacterium]
MRRRLFLTAALAGTLFALSWAAAAQEKIEGKVLSTKLTVCTFKPGGCEGTMVLGTAKPEQITIKVPLGTMIQKGSETVFLPALRGRTVSVTHVTEKGERIARSIDVK